MGDIFSATRGGFYGAWQTTTNRAQAGGSSSSIQLAPRSGLKGERRREPWHLNGGGETCCSPFESLRVGGLTSDGEGPQGLQEVSMAKGSTPPFRDVPLEQAGAAASSTLHLSETNVTPAVVFDNTARARLTGRRHNGTNRRASQTHKRVIISNDGNSKWKTTAAKISRSHLETPQHPHGVVCS